MKWLLVITMLSLGHSETDLGEPFANREECEQLGKQMAAETPGFEWRSSKSIDSKSQRPGAGTIVQCLEVPKNYKPGARKP